MLITALPPTARMMKANRIVQGVGITNPVGDPEATPEAETNIRRTLVEQSLRLLTEDGGT
ncbi:MAG: hypothetical protein JXA87_11730 [Thermoleophilia bacterium]|nr:hypothetical protein [Thermoleophilia bacterium]